jgi:cyclic pyranopterin phosphate synthase
MTTITPSAGTGADHPLRGPTAGEAPLCDPQGRLIDYLRVSVTDRCNYRCTYCMPEDGVGHVDRADILSFEEIATIVAAFVRLGVRRVRLTGGEPTVRRDLVQLAGMLGALPGLDDLALSTNGHLLIELAGPLRAAGVTRLNVSVDTLDPERFLRITRRGDLARVLAGLEAARGLGFASIKVNAVAVKGFNDGELGALCAYAWERDFLPRFIEQMPMADGALFVPGELLPAAEIRASIESAVASRLQPDATVAPGAGPARYLRVRDGRYAGKLVGVISPMTEHFCATCNRVRLSASGHLHTCLGHDDATDLRPSLAAGQAAVIAAIRRAVAAKRDGHDFRVAGLVGLGGPRKAMVQIGG